MGWFGFICVSTVFCMWASWVSGLGDWIEEEEGKGRMTSGRQSNISRLRIRARRRRRGCMGFVRDWTNSIYFWDSIIGQTCFFLKRAASLKTFVESRTVPLLSFSLCEGGADSLSPHAGFVRPTSVPSFVPSMTGHHITRFSVSINQGGSKTGFAVTSQGVSLST